MGGNLASFAAVMCGRDRAITTPNGLEEAGATATTRAPRARKQTI
jgi:hypothetical protein